jgi:bacteriocin-like protein
MRDNAIRELTDDELNEITGGFADPWSVLLGMTAVGVGYLVGSAIKAGAFDAIPYDQWFGK